MGKRTIKEIKSPVAWARAYRYGPYTVLVGFEAGRWHMVISHPKMFAPWDVVRDACHEFIPEHVTMVVMVPPKEQSGSRTRCLYLHEFREGKLTEQR